MGVDTFIIRLTLEMEKLSLDGGMDMVVRKGFQETCLKLIAKIVTEENKYWDEDYKIDENQGVDINQSVKIG